MTARGWEHDHCEFCSAKCGALADGDRERAGHATRDGYHGIREQCFADFRERFAFALATTDDSP
jgi:hypothetical protein